MGIESKISVGDISRLLELVSELSEGWQCTPAEAIENISQLLSGGVSKEERKRAVIADFISRVRRQRDRRNETFGGTLFRDPSWDMLLELYLSHERSDWLNVMALCAASGVPQTTALRHVERMEQLGLVTRHGLRFDGRLSIVKLTPKAIAGVREMATALLNETASSVGIAQASRSIGTQRTARSIFEDLMEISLSEPEEGAV